MPAQCFYVPYYAEGAKRSERWRIRRTDRSPLSIAGLWDRWVGDDGEVVVSFSILTLNCDLHPLLARFHRSTNDKGEPSEKRTPVLLAEEDFDAWLDTPPAARRSTSAPSARTTSKPSRRRRASRRSTAMMPLDTAISEL